MISESVLKKISNGNLVEEENGAIPRKTITYTEIKKNPTFNLLPFLKSKTQNEKSKQNDFFKKKVSISSKDNFIQIYTQNLKEPRRKQSIKLEKIAFSYSKSQSVPELTQSQQCQPQQIKEPLKRLQSIESVENENSDDEKSVVWNNDEMKIKGIDINQKSSKPLDQFVEIFKYRYETYPTRRSQLNDLKLSRLIQMYGRMNEKSQNKYFKENPKLLMIQKNYNYCEPYNAQTDSNYKQYDTYIAEAQKLPRKLKLKNVMKGY